MPEPNRPLWRAFIALAMLPSAIACQRPETDREEGALPSAPAVSDEMHALGEALFFDKILSGNQDISCATCHHPTLGTDDDLALSQGVGAIGLGVERSGGEIIPRNAPALFNLHAYETMFLDGRISLGSDGRLITPAGAQLTAEMESTLTFGMVAAQAMFPVTSNHEMRGLAGENALADLAADDFTGIWQGLMSRLGDIPQYISLFEAAYPGTPFNEMTFAHAANAIAGYEIREFERLSSPYQRFLAGDDRALSGRERRGMEEFFDAGCGDCHSGPLLSDFEHHNTALAQFGPGKGHGPNLNDDFGREGVTGDPSDRYLFRTPPLVNITPTGPYGHAGQFDSLREFVEHYRNPERSLIQYDMQRHVEQTELYGTEINNTDAVLATISPEMRDIGRFDVEDVVAFLRATSSRDDNAFSTPVPGAVPSGLTVD